MVPNVLASEGGVRIHDEKLTDPDSGAKKVESGRNRKLGKPSLTQEGQDGIFIWALHGIFLLHTKSIFLRVGHLKKSS